jgi:hypothetical protein
MDMPSDTGNCGCMRQPINFSIKEAERPIVRL